jgi:hypothetical protein
LSDLRFADPPPEARRGALRTALASIVPGWQPLAEDVLGADARIDWVGCDGEGRCVIALIGRAGDDLVLVAQGLAHRDWVAARLRDWAQLAPGSGLRAGAEVVAVLLAPSFGPAARAAARAAGPSLRLASLRFVANGSGIAPLVEPIADPRETASPGRGGFRSGLSAADLDLTPEERAEFERDR